MAKKLASHLVPGDVVVSSLGILTVKAVDASALFTIVDFTDGTSTAPLGHGTWMNVQKAVS